jgi:hypothetical protein
MEMEGQADCEELCRMVQAAREEMLETARREAEAEAAAMAAREAADEAALAAAVAAVEEEERKQRARAKEVEEQQRAPADGSEGNSGAAEATEGVTDGAGTMKRVPKRAAEESEAEGKNGGGQKKARKEGKEWISEY